MATQNVNLSYYNKEELTEAPHFTYGLVISDWNAHITQNMARGARETLLDLGVPSDSIQEYTVPGSFELVYAASQICKHKKHDVVIVIGSVIKGETAHFDYVCQGVTQGIKDLNIRYDIPVIFCVLTDNNEQQSIDRSGGKFGNKGIEAAVTAVKMTALKSNL